MGKPCSEETKKKIGDANRGKVGWRKGIPHTEESKKNISNSLIGKKRNPLSDDLKQRLSAAKLGKKKSEETKKRMSVARKGKPGHPHTEETKEKIGFAFRGEKHPAWKGGISKQKGYRKEYAGIYKHKYRVLKQGNGGSFTIAEWENLKEQYGYRCPMCGKKEPSIKLAADHIIPIAKGGDNNITNIQPLCRSCNSIKHTKIYRITPDGELMLF
uniref:Homing endonuclease n=1 Tax=viral metagenome TaxID=1070528 RepID=A0A6M3J652_9ZZZZ